MQVKYFLNGFAVTDGQTAPLQVDSSGNLKVAVSGSGASSSTVQGTAATNAAAVGNPVQVGGVYGTYTLDSGDVGPLRVSAYGHLLVSPIQVVSGADGVANTVGSLTAANDLGYPTLSAPMVFNGTTLDQLRGSTNGLYAQGSVASGVAAAGNPVQIGAIVEAAPTAVSADGTITRPKVDSRGYLHTNIGVGGVSVVTTTGVSVVPKATTSGGLDSARVVTGTTGVIKASAGQLYSLISVRNANAAVRYLHLYNKATAPTLSTDTPILTIALLASSVQNAIELTDIGTAFSAGIAWAYTTDNVAIPTTAGTSTELMFSAVYK